MEIIRYWVYIQREWLVRDRMVEEMHEILESFLKVNYRKRNEDIGMSFCLSSGTYHRNMHKFLYIKF